MVTVIGIITIIVSNTWLLSVVELCNRDLAKLINSSCLYCPKLLFETETNDAMERLEQLISYQINDRQAFQLLVTSGGDCCDDVCNLHASFITQYTVVL